MKNVSKVEKKKEVKFSEKRNRDEELKVDVERVAGGVDWVGKGGKII